MILGSLAKQSIPGLTVQSHAIKRVTIFKLIGVILSGLGKVVEINTIESVPKK